MSKSTPTLQAKQQHVKRLATKKRAAEDTVAECARAIGVEAAALAEDGVSWAELARWVGTSPQAVKKLADRYGPVKVP